VLLSVCMVHRLCYCADLLLVQFFTIFATMSFSRSSYPGTPFTSFTVLSAGATEVTPLVPGYGSGGEGATFSRAEHAVLYTNGTMQRYSLRLHFY
jgi:hypothetical protein